MMWGCLQGSLQTVLQQHSRSYSSTGLRASLKLLASTLAQEGGCTCQLQLLSTPSWAVFLLACSHIVHTQSGNTTMTASGHACCVIARMCDYVCMFLCSGPEGSSRNHSSTGLSQGHIDALQCKCNPWKVDVFMHGLVFMDATHAHACLCQCNLLSSTHASRGSVIGTVLQGQQAFQGALRAIVLLVGSQ